MRNYFRNFIEYKSNTVIVGNLESWRGLLAWLVVFSHYEWIIIQTPLKQPTPYISVGLYYLSTFSVGLFFLISGISIAFSVEKNNNGNFKFVNFLTSRVTRIYVPLLATLVLCIGFYYLLLILGRLKIDSDFISPLMARKEFVVTFSGIIEQIIFRGAGLTTINGSLWTLSIEWWIYVSVAFLAITFTTKNNLLRIFSFLIFIKILELSGSLRINNYSIDIGPVFVYGLIWFIGFSYFYFRSFKTDISIFLLGFLLLCIFFYISDYKYMTRLESIMLILCIFLLPIITKCSLGVIFSKIGKSSYSAYIVHYPICLFFLFAFPPKNLNEYAMLLYCILCLSSIVLVTVFFGKYLENRKILLFLNNKIYFSFGQKIDNFLYRVFK